MMAMNEDHTYQNNMSPEGRRLTYALRELPGRSDAANTMYFGAFVSS